MHPPKVKLAVSMSPALLRVKAVVARKRFKSVPAYVEHAVAAQLASDAPPNGATVTACATCP